MKATVVISVLCFISLVSAVPVPHRMVYYRMPYYNPYQEAMLVHYSPSFGRSVGASSAFASGDAVAAGTLLRENRVQIDASRAVEQQESSNDGNVEAIAEAYPEEPIHGAVQYDQAEEQYNEVIPLNTVPLAEQPEPVIKAVVSEEPQVQTTTLTPKKKVHIALDIPEKHDETEGDDDDDDDQYPYAPQKPNRAGSPMTFFPVSFGRAAGGTIAVANAYSTGKGAVRSHAIAYGTNGASRRNPVAERNVNAAQKRA